MRMKTITALVSLLAAQGALAQQVTGPSSSQSPYVTPTSPLVTGVTSIMIVG